MLPYKKTVMTEEFLPIDVTFILSSKNENEKVCSFGPSMVLGDYRCCCFRGGHDRLVYFDAKQNGIRQVW